MHARGIGHLPPTLLAAVEALSGDEVVRNSLGAEYADYYIQVKTEEWESYHNSVGQWELDATSTFTENQKENVGARQ